MREGFQWIIMAVLPATSSGNATVHRRITARLRQALHILGHMFRIFTLMPGIIQDVDVNLYYAQAGDVIHVGSTAPTRHALVVVGDYKVNGKTVDILVNSNTVDLENYPMSAYSYPYSRLIKIYGWND